MARRCLSLVMSAALLVLMAPAAGAATPAFETGVWWAPQPSDGALHPPGEVPENGLWLQSSPAAQTAMSALRRTLGDNLFAQTLTLAVQSDGSSTAGQTVDLCVVSTPWTRPSASPGVYANRAVADCAALRLRGVRSPDGATVRFNLSALPPSRTVDLVLTRPETTTAAIDLIFKAPREQDLTTRPAIGTARPPAPTVPAVPTRPTAPTVSGGGGAAIDDGLEPAVLRAGPVATAGTALSEPPFVTGAPLLPQLAGPSSGSNVNGTVTRAVPRAAPLPVPVTNRAYFLAFALFAGLCLWIARIISVTPRVADRPVVFTLYRGTPPP